MEDIILFTIGFIIAFLTGKFFLGRFQEKEPTAKDILNYPWVEIEGTRFEEYIERKIEFATMERNIQIEQLFKLADKLGYKWESNKEFGWIKTKKTKRR